METINYIVIYSGVKRSTQAEVQWFGLLTNQTHHYCVHKLERKKNWGKTTNGLYTLEEGRVEINKTFRNQLQEILNKTNKNDYVLLSGDLNAE
jgi:hypothetical protein